MSNSSDTIENRIKIFRKQQDKFRDHPLLTELPNPDTYNLSELAKNDPKEGILSILNTDIKVVQKIPEYIKDIKQLQKDIRNTIKNGNKIFICGCGSSGRLAVCLEYLWRMQAPEILKDSLIGFLAGGDNAMIKSIEGFEDHEEYGIKQLMLAGFKDGDLLIGSSASGESYFVIGAVRKASESSVKPWFIHCNTNETLSGRIKNHIIDSPNIKIMSLYVGQMALSGSTRMQATTALMLGIGLPLFYNNISRALLAFEHYLQNLNPTGMEYFIIREGDIYKNKEFLFFETNIRYGVTVLTDTTERAPTFNVVPFENQLDKDKTPSWCYLLFSNSNNSSDAWNTLLGRAPRTLEWTKETSLSTLLGFDFSKELIKMREQYATPSHYFRIERENGKLILSLDEFEKSFEVQELSLLLEQLLLKILLNTCSTLVMGRLGYYEGNFMTSLYPSNSKLIDRAIRYIDFTLKVKENISLDYNTIAKNMFIELKKLQPNESIVLKTVERLKMLWRKTKF